MFENLQDRLGSILNNLTGRGALSEKDVSEAMREVRRALLEADVALEVVRGFTDRVREKAVGAEIVKSIKPGQMVVKLVHDELVALLGSKKASADRSQCGRARRHHDGRPAGLGQDHHLGARSPRGWKSATARKC
jgi:signal recognition particle subunit SRP54